MQRLTCIQKLGDEKGFINDSVRVLDHTEAFEFLDVLDDEIKKFAKNVVKKNNPNLSNREINDLVCNYLYGNFDDKNNITKGLWGIISENFAKQTKGDVICHVGDTEGAVNRVWWNVEMPQILSGDSGVTSINGYSAEELRRMYAELGGSDNTQALDKINRTIAESAFVEQAETNSSADVDDSSADNKDITDEQSGNKKTDADVEEKIATEKENNSESKINENKNNTGNTEETGKGEDVKSKDTDTDTVKKEELTSKEETSHEKTSSGEEAKPRETGSNDTAKTDTATSGDNVKHQDAASNSVVNKTESSSTKNQADVNESHSKVPDESTSAGDGHADTNKPNSSPDAETGDSKITNKNTEMETSHTDIDMDGKNKHIDTDIRNSKLTDEAKDFLDLYESTTRKKVTSTISDAAAEAINKGAKVLEVAGNVMDIVDAIKVVHKAGELYSEGKKGEAGKVIRDYMCSTLTSIVVTEAAAILLAAAAVTNPIVVIIALGVAGYVGSEMGENISDLLAAIFNLYNDAGAYTYPVDPLIFDLDGDGIETVSVKNGVNFDFDNNGFAEKIGWVSPDDGLLVRDLNSNGNIDNGGELFGDLTAIADGVTAVNGFEALKALDANGDGVIDANDEIYAELKIWQDKNQNGVVEEGELLALQETGIAAIGLDYNTMNQTDEQGNVHTQEGYYVKADGSTALVEDVWFDKDAADTVLADGANEYAVMEETEEIRRLPDLLGNGNQYSLHQAMLRDETGTLQRLVEQYIKEESMLTRKSMLTQIIYVWTGVADRNPSARGENLSDARKLEALEVITGREFSSMYGSNPVAQTADYIEQALYLMELVLSQRQVYR